MLEDSLPISDDSRKKRGCCCSLIYFICCLWEAKNRMGSIHFPKPAWGWWHGCHWLLLSLMGLHYNGASESKSPRRRWAVCLADRLWCKRLVISCYSKQHNCLVKGEWRQIDLSMFRLCRMCFHGVHPWNEHVYSSTSERSRRGQYHLPAQKSTDVKKKKKSVQRLCGGTTVCGRSGQVLSLSLLVFVLLSADTFFHSFPLRLLSLSHYGSDVFGQFVLVAPDFQADLANFWSVQ